MIFLKDFAKMFLAAVLLVKNLKAQNASYQESDNQPSGVHLQFRTVWPEQELHEELFSMKRKYAKSIRSRVAK